MISYTSITTKGAGITRNQDFHLLPPDDDELCAELGYLFVLTEGLGNLNGGELASRKTAEWFREFYYFQLSFPEDPLPDMRYLLNTTSSKLLELKDKNPLFNSVSSTFCSGVFYDNSLYMLSVGNNRVYRLRRGRLAQLTEDHSLGWEMYKKGRLSRDELQQHPQRGLVTSALGISEDFEVYQRQEPTKSGDLYLFCSDGLHDAIPDTELSDCLRQPVDLKQKAKQLLDLAVNNGLDDNLTFILVKLD